MTDLFPNRYSNRILLFSALALMATALGLGRLSTPAAAASFSTGATVSPSSVAAGSSAAISAQVTSSASMSTLVDVEVYSASGAKVYQQYWDNQSLTAGQVKTFNATWNVPASQAPGTYTVKIGVFTPGWGSQLSWNNSAAQFSITAATTGGGAGFSTSAAALPATVSAGGSTTITLQVTSSTSLSALVDLEVYNSGGSRVFQLSWDNQSLTAGQAKSYSGAWAVPAAQPAGIYTVKAGIFTPGWGSQLNWNANAGQIGVTAPSSTPTATATLPPIATPSATATSSGPASFTTMAIASPSSVTAGSSATITLQVATTATIAALVDLEVYNGAGSKVFQQFWDNQTLTAGGGAPFGTSAQNVFVATWSVPSSQGTGTYTLKAGIFTPGWGSQLNWNSNAGQISVTSPGGTPTATATATATATPSGSNGSPAGGVHVSGNQLVNNAGQSVRLHGVNRSGTEYACIQGWGIFDGPSDAGSISAIASWKVNAVRVPLNEDCWLGINGAASAYSGANYQQAIVNYVNTITSAGLAAIIDLHWTAPGTTKATAQQPMPDMDHSPAFWGQVANTFKGNSAVIYELFNEPFAGNSQASSADWACWRDGGTCADVTYQVAGMQTLLNSIRQTGANNTVLLGGMAWSNDLSQWMKYEPSDSAHNTAAAWHVYEYNSCSSSSCYSSVIAPVAASVPVVATEIGEDDCSGAFISPLMSWLDSESQSYAAWTWDTWGTSCGAYSLITSYAGAATSPYGQTYHDHLASLP